MLRRKVLKFGVIIAAVGLVVYLLVFYRLNTPDRRFGLAFRPYPDSELIYETSLLSDNYLTTRVMVYWTEDLLSEVENYSFISDEQVMMRRSEGVYYVSDSITMSTAEFGYATGPFIHEMCAFNVNPESVTMIHVYFQPANGEPLTALEPMRFGCAVGVKLDASAIPVHDAGTYIIVGYNRMVG